MAGSCLLPNVKVIICWMTETFSRNVQAQTKMFSIKSQTSSISFQPRFNPANMNVFNNTTDTIFDSDVNDVFNASIIFENVTTNVIKSVVRHNCTGADEESMKTYHKVSWWFAGIVQVQ